MLHSASVQKVVHVILMQHDCDAMLEAFGML